MGEKLRRAIALAYADLEARPGQYLTPKKVDAIHDRVLAEVARWPGMTASDALYDVFAEMKIG